MSYGTRLADVCELWIALLPCKDLRQLSHRRPDLLVSEVANGALFPERQGRCDTLFLGEVGANGQSVTAQPDTSSKRKRVGQTVRPHLLARRACIGWMIGRTARENLRNLAGFLLKMCHLLG